MTKRFIPAALATLGILASSGAFAQTAPAPAPWRGDFWGYIGASAGESKFRSECHRTVTQFECDHKDTGWKVYAGGKFNEIFGLEIAYVDFGGINAGGGEIDAWAVPLTVTAGLPLGERFNVFAKAGGLYGRTDVRVNIADSITAAGRQNGWGWTYGVGATFAVTPNFQIRADWDRHKLDFVNGREDVDLLTAGVQFRF